MLLTTELVLYYYFLIFPTQCPVQCLAQSGCGVSADWKISWVLSKWENQFTNMLHTGWSHLYEVLENASESDQKKNSRGQKEKWDSERWGGNVWGCWIYTYYLILMMASLWFMCVKPHHTVCSVCNLLYFICDSVKVYNKDREVPVSLVVSTLCSTVEGPGSIPDQGTKIS